MKFQDFFLRNLLVLLIFAVSCGEKQEATLSDVGLYNTKTGTLQVLYLEADRVFKKTCTKMEPAPAHRDCASNTEPEDRALDFFVKNIDLFTSGFNRDDAGLALANQALSAAVKEENQEAIKNLSEIVSNLNFILELVRSLAEGVDLSIYDFNEQKYIALLAPFTYLEDGSAQLPTWTDVDSGWRWVHLGERTMVENARQCQGLGTGWAMPGLGWTHSYFKRNSGQALEIARGIFANSGFDLSGTSVIRDGKKEPSEVFWLYCDECWQLGQDYMPLFFAFRLPSGRVDLEVDSDEDAVAPSLCVHKS